MCPWGGLLVDQLVEVVGVTGQHDDRSREPQCGRGHDGIDGIDAAVSYAGGAAGQVAGLMRIDVTIPDGAHSGAVPVLLKVGPFQSQTGVTVVVQ